jgi:thiol-disulfide isomerase/thioredoxin
MMKNILLVLLLGFVSCSKETPTQFSEAALQEQFVALNGETVNFESILEKHKGKTILITIWATWCRDCISEMPRIKEVQQQKNDVVYVFLSLDRSIENWIKGISKFEIKGDHYFMPKGWYGDFVNFIDLDWITRYMLIDHQGNIKIYEAVKVNNKYLRESLTN